MVIINRLSLILSSLNCLKAFPIAAHVCWAKLVHSQYHFYFLPLVVPINTYFPQHLLSFFEGKLYTCITDDISRIYNELFRGIS